MRSTSLAFAGFVVVGALGGCSTTRESARAAGPVAESVPTPVPSATRAPGAPGATGATGPMDVESLARELGLRAVVQGPGYLLSNSDVNARVYPGNRRLTVDGRAIDMGDEARRVGTTLLVPAGGVEALRSEVALAARHRSALARAVAPIAIPVVAAAPKAPAPVVLSPVRSPSPRPTSGGDPSWIPSIAERSWKYVVIHHSDDSSGSCAKYDSVHRGQGWENGCGYHFVIGNGTQTGDGEVEIGPRWARQIQGAHAKTADNRYNEMGVGIVLVGDFEHGGKPTARQLESLVRLTRWIMARYGIPVSAILRHSDCKSTACPGRNFPWARFTADVAR